MNENTNKAKAVNSIIMNARMGINTILILALFTTYYALQALGVIDFSAFGGIISFMSVFNIIILVTCNRFPTTAIGKGDAQYISKTFNINLL